MTATDVVKFRKILEAKQQETVQTINRREGIKIEQSADTLDEVQNATARELAVRNLDRESVLLREIRSALRRVEEGSLGICLHCEGEISQKRLNAIPWASLCVQCQQQAEHRKRNSSDDKKLLLNAA